MKRLHTQSQNFLRSPALVKKLVGHSNLKKTDTVYDLGAGSGTITSVLATSCHKVIAVEYDKRMVRKLHENLADSRNVTIINGDALTVALPTDEYKVFANIPFHLSSPIVRRLTESAHPPQAIYLIVQKQFAKKLVIESSDFTGLLGAFIAPRYTARIRYRLQRTDFWPHPAVDTVFIELLLRKKPLIDDTDMARYRDFIERCFSRQKYFDAFKLNKRPSELSTSEWIGLFSRQRTAS